MPNEKRLRRRISYKADVIIETSDTIIRGQTMNISLRGLYVKTKKRLPPNTPCTLRIKLEDGQSAAYLSFEGVVIRVDDKGMGIRFISIKPESFFHLRNILYYYLGNEELVDKELMKDAF